MARQRPTLARIASAEAVQTNGLGSELRRIRPVEPAQEGEELLVASVFDRLDSMASPGCVMVTRGQAFPLRAAAEIACDPVTSFA